MKRIIFCLACVFLTSLVGCGNSEETNKMYIQRAEQADADQCEVLCRETSGETLKQIALIGAKKATNGSQCAKIALFLPPNDEVTKQVLLLGAEKAQTPGECDLLAAQATQETRQKILMKKDELERAQKSRSVSQDTKKEF